MEAAAMRRVTVLLLLTIVLPGFQPWGQEAGGNRAYRRGDYVKAVERYRGAIQRRGSTPRLQYNLGTALLQLGEWEAARERLSEAVQAQSPELQSRAFYNLGNALAGDPSAVTAETLRAAIRAYRRSLLLDPERADTRWNLELAMRRLQELESSRQPLSGPEQRPTPPEGEGAGVEEGPVEGGPQSVQPRAGPAERRQATGPEAVETPLPRGLAEQVLRAVEERERGLQREKLRRQRRRVRGPDW